MEPQPQSSRPLPEECPPPPWWAFWRSQHHLRMVRVVGEQEVLRCRNCPAERYRPHKHTGQYIGTAPYRDYFRCVTCGEHYYVPDY